MTDAPLPARRPTWRQLLEAERPLVLPGAFDGLSARLIEQAGFKAMVVGGYSLVGARYGLPDVGLVGLGEMAEGVRDILDASRLPALIDGDHGYGDVKNVTHTVRTYERMGAAALFIEDQVAPKRCGHMAGKDIIDAREMARKVEAACDARRDDDFVILARTDAIAVEGLEGAIRRAQLYAKAGADMIFADAIGGEDQIKALVDALDVPVSVNMGFGIRTRPTTPLIPLKSLAEIGVKRVTLPRMLPAAAIQAMESALAILKQSTGSGEIMHRPDLLASIDDIWALMGQPEFKRQEARYNNLEGLDL